MRFRVTALVTGLLAVAGMVLGIGLNTAPALAQSLGTSYICTTNASPNACINNTLGTLQPHGLQFWANNSEGAADNSWVPNVIGHVTNDPCGETWPFDCGSGLNDRYNGDDVIQFNLAKNNEYCMDQGNFAGSDTEGVLRLYGCASSTNQDFVLSDYDGNYYLIAVGASNTLYSYYKVGDRPVWVSAPDGTENGELVFMDTSAQLTWEIINA